MHKKVGILGGTFDPFHKGHLLLAKAAYEQFDLDEIWIMPNGNPPHKKEIEQTEFDIRCEMIQISIAGISYMVLCKEEGSDVCYHYTYQTLEKLKNKYPENDIYFIIGADSLNDFPTWRKPERIARLCTLLVASRDTSGIALLRKKISEMEELFQADCRILDFPRVDAASKDIRSMISNGKDVSEYLDENVCNYIKKMGLYTLE